MTVIELDQHFRKDVLVPSVTKHIDAGIAEKITAGDIDDNIQAIINAIAALEDAIDLRHDLGSNLDSIRPIEGKPDNPDISGLRPDARNTALDAYVTNCEEFLANKFIKAVEQKNRSLPAAKRQQIEGAAKEISDAIGPIKITNRPVTNKRVLAFA